MHNDSYVVIMAGGIGSRFWPFSRTSNPKQFHDVLGTGRSLIQQTVDRFHDVCPKENIYIVTNKDYYQLVKNQLPFLDDDQILLEPVGKNTAPCVAYAAHKIVCKNPNANIVVSPADHVILNEKEFEKTIKTALYNSYNKDVLITLGIKPSRPDTGYGYIQYIEGNSALKKVKTFTEKPHLELAQTFLDSGDFVWNSGIFIWSAKAVIKAIEAHLPEMHELFHEGQKYYSTEKEESFVEQAYPQCKSISIDYGIMEKSDNVFVLLSDFGWSDLGTWKSLYDIMDKDADQNVIEANAMLYDTNNCIIKTSKDKLVVIQGLSNYIVAESDGIIMICQKDEEQRVKEFVADAKAKKDKRFI
ncbi:mannose-1-phosphate guanylyltransferase [Flexibacter flexilis DSM 6793]|uniref:mannose-1-phosphate guanylyltransferase n=1 Tax=Flexibacter flexilis DSM 6793 TaxID=927664 RepID=A0A1I1NI45_9BACT|nr:mannose-1-phosphate guanylyltransferase [Flexibacter flexilis]SFC96942.1 mannose-1-phosphate guanylyltransferase [Flexibacter flexilis DSM 6793]